jgi:hypothetical protein
MWLRLYKKIINLGYERKLDLNELFKSKIEIPNPSDSVGSSLRKNYDKSAVSNP